MNQYLFLQGSELFYVEVEGEIPAKPTDDPVRAKNNQVCLTFKGISCTTSKPCGCVETLNRYTSAIASIKAKGVKVGNAEPLGDIKSFSGTETFQNVGRIGEFSLPYFSDSNQFLPIECDVSYKHACQKTYDFGNYCESPYCFSADAGARERADCDCRVAILSPVSKQKYEVDKYTGETMRITAQPFPAVVQSNSPSEQSQEDLWVEAITALLDSNTTSTTLMWQEEIKALKSKYTITRKT